ncbi:hypothetical protein [Shinella zoogloeoides]|uniref:hypothetical protein n=1 Tax=Shinella zoogloeoides TaxID=352475 RepID=UPI00273E025F|nr:hypothetical protein [Shinella zoogloeoides]WLR94016.1 hypothetical protein Q9316_07485 [Shinella zoogloeoides]
MTSSIKALFASALFAASVLGGSQALAAGDGEYYQGVTPPMADGMNHAQSAEGDGVDLFSTQSINKPDEGADPTSGEISPADGDYYQGTEEQR